MIENFILQHGKHVGESTTRLLDKKDVLQLLELLKKNDREVYGFDGFIVSNDMTKMQIEQDYSRDYSKFSKEDAWALCIEYFHKDRSENVLYEIVYDKKNL